MNKAYKFRIYPNKTQENLIQKTFGCCRYVYNHFLALKKDLHKNGEEGISCYDTNYMLTALKKEDDKAWLNEVDAHALITSLKDLDDAYKHFFRRVKKGGEAPGFPKFKNKADRYRSYRTRANSSGGKVSNIAIFENHIKLPKLGLVKAVISNKVKGRILNATISQTPSGKYFLAICCADVDIPKYESTGAMVGIDRGMKNLITTSDGAKYPNPKHYMKLEKKLAKAQRELSKKKSGGANWEKARKRLAKIHEKIVNQRKDTINKLTTSLVKDYDVICIESLASKEMKEKLKKVKKGKFKPAKNIADAAWGEVGRQLGYKCDWQSKMFVKVDKFYPSNQICNTCNTEREEKTEYNREWACTNCKTVNGRNENSAKNILEEGLRQAGI